MPYSLRSVAVLLAAFLAAPALVAREPVRARQATVAALEPQATDVGVEALTSGAPVGSRIITGAVQVILNVIDFGMTVREAVDQPRFPHQWQPDVLRVETGFSPDTLRLIESMGHKIQPISPVASVEAIFFDGGWLQGAQNGRSGGKAAGY